MVIGCVSLACTSGCWSSSLDPTKKKGSSSRSTHSSACLLPSPSTSSRYDLHLSCWAFLRHYIKWTKFDKLLASTISYFYLQKFFHNLLKPSSSSSQKKMPHTNHHSHRVAHIMSASICILFVILSLSRILALHHGLWWWAVDTLIPILKNNARSVYYLTTTFIEPNDVSVVLDMFQFFLQFRLPCPSQSVLQHEQGHTWESNLQEFKRSNLERLCRQGMVQISEPLLPARKVRRIIVIIKTIIIIMSRPLLSSFQDHYHHHVKIIIISSKK